MTERPGTRRTRPLLNDEEIQPRKSGLLAVPQVRLRNRGLWMLNSLRRCPTNRVSRSLSHTSLRYNFIDLFKLPLRLRILPLSKYEKRVINFTTGRCNLW